MPCHWIRFISRVVLLCWLLGVPTLSHGQGLSACLSDPVELSDKIGCALWRLMGYMHPKDGDDGVRLTDPVLLGPDLWAQAEISVKSLDSAWPQQFYLRYYENPAQDDHLVEAIRDHGLDGLNPDDSTDEYLRYSGKGSSKNLLLNLDPVLKTPINEEYLAHLMDLLGVLEQKTKVHGPIVWRELAPGLEQAQVKAFRFLRLGVNTVYLLRVNPLLYDLVPYSEKEPEADPNLNIEGWAQKIPEALALFNSGQYYPDKRYIGYLFKDGIDLGTGVHPTWKALLLSGGPCNNPALPPSTILDLEFHPFKPDRSFYRFAIQSFMLLDHQGLPRVRQTDRLASRTAVAQDFQGRMVVVVVPGACTLYELALFLKNSDLGLKQAMCMDGGFETQLYVREPEKDLIKYGAWVVNERRQYYYEDGLRVPLPSIVAVIPRTPY